MISGVIVPTKHPNRAALSLKMMLELGVTASNGPPVPVVRVERAANLNNTAFSLLLGTPVRSELPAPHSSQPVIFTCEDKDCVELTAYTDGSTSQDSLQNIGYSAVITRSDDPSPPSRSNSICFGGGFRASFNNYLAEALGVLAVLLMVPANCKVTIWTDCLSLINALAKRFVAQGRQIREGARPVINMIRHVREARSAPLVLLHVRSHTKESSRNSQGNDLADILANEARRRYAFTKFPPFLLFESPFVFWRMSDRPSTSCLYTPPALSALRLGLRSINATHIVGNIRKELKRGVRGYILQRWANQPSQGRLARLYPDGVMAQLDFVRKEGNPWLLSFFMMASCSWLPVADRRSWASDPRDPSRTCSLCPLQAPQSTEHIFTCQGVGGVGEIRRSVTDLVYRYGPKNLPSYPPSSSSPPPHPLLSERMRFINPNVIIGGPNPWRSGRPDDSGVVWFDDGKAAQSAGALPLDDLDSRALLCKRVAVMGVHPSVVSAVQAATESKVLPCLVVWLDQPCPFPDASSVVIRDSVVCRDLGCTLWFWANEFAFFVRSRHPVTGPRVGPRWFDPTDSAPIASPFGCELEDPLAVYKWRSIDNHDRLAGTLGILPEFLLEVLRPDRLKLPEWEWSEYESTSVIVEARVRSVLVYGALGVFQAWKAADSALRRAPHLAVSELPRLV
jgi:ribonuclease HI